MASGFCRSTLAKKASRAGRLACMSEKSAIFIFRDILGAATRRAAGLRRQRLLAVHGDAVYAGAGPAELFDPGRIQVLRKNVVRQMDGFFLLDEHPGK